MGPNLKNLKPKNIQVGFKMRRVALAFALSAALASSALSQGTVPGQYMVPLGNCQLTASQLASAIGLSKCTRASFTASAGSSSTLLVVTSVTGIILIGDTLLTGTGITAGTTIVNQVSGTPGGAGTYTISAANTASSASATSGGIPPQATMVMLQAETANVRYRDDGGAPTNAIGMLIVSGQNPMLYTGSLSSLQFILNASGSPLLDAEFYRQ
jgi:hypothetical protein